MTKKNILIIDDERGVRESLNLLFKDKYHTFLAPTGKQALDIVENEDIDLIFLDLVLPDMDGMDILRQVHTKNPYLPIIVISGHRKGVRDAVDAMQEGAYDFFTKPFNANELNALTQKVMNAIESKVLKEEIIYLRDELNKTYQLETLSEIVGQSQPIKTVIQTINKIKDKDSTVLIQGDTGTGKELVARAIHYNSHRKDHPFIVIHCAAVSPTLFESELFGHERGSFTGAYKTRKGSFEVADEGTVFLDEIGEIPLDIQVKLLRVLQEKAFRRVGGTETIEIDIRLIAATHGNLEAMIKEGKFRQDLYYRLNVIPLKIPLLRDRKEDIPILIEHFLELFKKKLSIPRKYIAPEALEIFQKYNWPGNVRELENVLERLCVTVEEDTITADHINSLVGFPVRTKPKIDINQEGLNLKEAVNEYEKTIIVEALQKSQGNVKEALKLLNISKQVFYYKLKALNIKR